MTRSLRAPARPLSVARRNVLAVLVCLGACGALYLEYESPVSSVGDEPVDLSRFSASASAAHARAEANGAARGGAIEGTEALQKNLELLRAGEARLVAAGDYTAVLLKQERIGGQMGEPQVMQLKLRHEPFSVYMRWLAGDDAGREVLYVAGENDGEMVVKLGGVKGRLLPAVKVDPNGPLALAEARHPITDVGLLNLTRKLINRIGQDLADPSHVRCTMLDNQQFGGRDCVCFIREFDSQDYDPPYRKSVQYIDRQLCVPLSIQNYCWPREEGLAPEALDEATLIEHYAYSEVQLDQRLADRDFDRDNAKYSFRR